MRVLITGASGMLGATLCNILKDKYTVFGTGNSNFQEAPKNYKKFDLYSENYTELIEWSNPDVIILSGALTNGNFCQDNPQKAFEINGLSVKKFIDATANSVKLIYISTDAVFPSALHMATETDCVKPENIYGKSKELGEFFTLNSNREFCVIRTTIVGFNLNSNKKGFVEWIINSSKQKEGIGLYGDVVFTPISIWHFAEEISFLLSNKELPNEILHISGIDISTKYNFGSSLLKALGITNPNLKQSSILNFEGRAKRCTDQSLDSNYYQKKFNRTLPNLSSTIESIKQYYHE